MKSVVEMETYPLDEPGGRRWQSLEDRARADLAAGGMFSLPGFLKPDAVQKAVAELAPRMAGAAFTHARRHNIYFKREVSGLPPDHPALQEFETVNHTLCADQMAGSVVINLYEWPPFAQFLAAAMDKPALYTMDDPLARVNTMAYRSGEALNWHFDRSEFTTTLLLQAPDGGGDFEYRTNLRSDDDPNYDGVARLVAGEDSEVQQVHLAPGTLNVFRGKNTAHRVTPVEGPTDRIISVFSLYERPGVKFNREEQLGFYGRAA